MPKKLNLTLHDIEYLLRQFGSPLYVYDYDLILENAKRFMNVFRSNYKNFEQYFAVKSLPNRHILKILESADMGFDCSSVFELKMSEKISSKLLYSSNYTSVEDLCEVLKSNAIINLDDSDGFINLLEACAITKINIPELICFRLNPQMGTTSSETKSNVLGGIDTKFGIPDYKIIDAYKLAADNGVKKFGIHVMTGSCIMDIEYFEKLIDVVFERMSIIRDTLGISFEFVDLGGGIGIPYKPDVPDIDLEILAKVMADAVNKNISKYSFSESLKIFMENGRYITGPYGWLLSKCKSIKIGYDDIKFYGLDACMANLMRPGMYGAYHHITVPRLKDSDDFENVNIVGSLCENNDWFAKQRPMPKNIIKNDIFVIHDAGAHSHCMGFQYNGKMRSAEVLFKFLGENLLFKQIRHKETTCFASTDA